MGGAARRARFGISRALSLKKTSRLYSGFKRTQEEDACEEDLPNPYVAEKSNGETMREGMKCERNFGEGGGRRCIYAELRGRDAGDRADLGEIYNQERRGMKMCQFV